MIQPGTLILGGVRSGKSRLAEHLARASALPVTYVATSAPPPRVPEAGMERGHEEMRRRIEAHRARRPDSWRLVEEPLRLAAALRQADAPDTCLLVDCLTLWLTNLLIDDDPTLFAQERQALLDALPTLQSRVILVSNETNMGITPLGELTRRYCDEAGLLHQDVAQVCDEVILTVAGLPHYLKRHTVLEGTQ